MTRPRWIAIFLAVALGAAAADGSLIRRAAAQAQPRRNPFAGDAQARRAGAKLYERECAACHGLNREGGRKAPGLRQPEVFEAAPGTLFWVLRNGSLHRGMPSFAHLPEPARWQIITFLQNRDAQ